MARSLLNVINMLASVLLLLCAGCTVSVDKRVGVWFDQGSAPKFHPLDTPDVNESGAVDGQPGHLASATAESASWQLGYFNFNTRHESATEADLEQAIRAGLQANVPVQGSSVDAETNDTGGVTTGSPEE